MQVLSSNIQIEEAIHRLKGIILVSEVYKELNLAQAVLGPLEVSMWVEAACSKSATQAQHFWAKSLQELKRPAPALLFPKLSRSSVVWVLWPDVADVAQ